MTSQLEAAARRDHLIACAHARMMAAERLARARHAGTENGDHDRRAAEIEGAVLRCRAEVQAARDEYARWARRPWRRQWDRLREWLLGPAKPPAALRPSEGRESDGKA